MRAREEISPSNQRAVVTKQLHPSALKRAQQQIDDFATALVFQAKLIAFKERAELVLQRHMDEAATFIFLQRKKEWAREFAKIMGGTFIGASIPGLITSLPTNDITSSVIYIVLGFFGLIFVFLGLMN